MMLVGESPTNRKPTVKKEIIDLCCGTIAGFNYCISGYVLDTVKVRIQNQPTGKSLEILKSILFKEGIGNIFSGIYYPLTTMPLVNAVLFGSYELYKKVMGKTTLSFMDGIENGAFSGFANSFIVSPVEYVKCVMQTDKHNTFKNSRECLRYIIKKDGWRGPFKGLFTTIVREVPCYAGQFAVYQYLKDLLVDEKHPALTFVEGTLIGSVSGVNCWLLSYPQDLIKTKIQLAQRNRYRRNKWIPDGGFWSCGEEIYKKDGWRGLWRGLQPCSIRAIIASGFQIATYQKCQQYCHKQFHLY